MKLKGLLLSTDFDALIPALKKEGSLTIRQYREAYDILCHLTPVDNSDIENHKKEEEKIKSEFQMLAGKGKLVFGTREVSSDVVDLHFTILIQKYEKRQPQTYSDGYRHLFS